MEQEQKLTADQIIKFLEERNFKELKEELENLHPVDLVDAMEELDKIVVPENYTGRSAEQVTEFIENDVKPALAAFHGELGKNYELTV